MAVSSSVPYNFGVEYFDSDHYSNIEIILKDGSRVKANTVILSKNSAFFKELIENESPKVIEMDEHDAIVCRTFLESLYTGHFENLDKSNFRHVSKLSFTCKVTWMQNNCIQHFRQMMHTSHTNDELFLMEEAIAAKEFDKECHYLNALAHQKTQNLSIQHIEFVETMLQDFGTVPRDNLDFFIRLANLCERNWNLRVNRDHVVIVTDPCDRRHQSKEYCTVIMEKVTAHIVNVGKIDVKTRDILQNVNFKSIAAKFNDRRNRNQQLVDPFRAAASNFFQSLLDLQDISNDDLKMAFRQYMSLGN